MEPDVFAVAKLVQCGMAFEADFANSAPFTFYFDAIAEHIDNQIRGVAPGLFRYLDIKWPEHTGPRKFHWVLGLKDSKRRRLLIYPKPTESVNGWDLAKCCTLQSGP